ncbi:peptidylprolyl isomerase [Micromonospora pattaloongensis]|uniref:Peptidyl-prolyl cis-trans isomerase n=1 Tax=Micromonospora pattaloongensis TaxID=405436 RepID=A0A1H3RUB5_9ACTN|nr:FKBP-type peptidyl-prolyl cis-trans isomerase [Micromonospora pattaloongensis]SDZ28925.1 peptidylprolyl isomerase [Micromonospora pattaloongensis]
MSDRVDSTPRGGSENGQRATPTGGRAAATTTTAQNAASRRGGALTGALAGLVMIAALIALVVVLNQKASEPDPAPAAAATPAPTAPAPEPTAPEPTAPALPAGVDPALASKPAASAGTGTLTKLTVTPVIKGSGPTVRAGQTITVNYVGVHYATGEEFDSSWARSTPASFQIGVGQVLPGWDRGLVGVTVGSRVQLDIPAALAYGDNATGGRPAGPLRFIVDVLAVQ